MGVPKCAADIQWKKDTYGFSWGKILSFHPLHCAPITTALCRLVLDLLLNSPHAAKTEVLYSAAVHQTSFLKWFLSRSLPESRSLAGTNAVNGLMWAQQALGLLL